MTLLRTKGCATSRGFREVAGCPIQRALCVEWDSTTAKSVGSPSSRRAGNKAPKPRCHPERSEGGGWATSPPLKQKYDPTQNQGVRHFARVSRSGRVPHSTRTLRWVGFHNC